ncbi:hypothetical protein F66182_10776 [Fusarium sp. NRRL 66182]|nr:hypothetical protein F66182_10776 [Fusarium sp. NRRL 66182]
MAPSDNEIEQALLDSTYQVYKASPDETSVNKVRKQAEENLGLENGFLSSDEWKQKSKALIKERVTKLLDGWEPAPKDEDGSDGETAKNAGVKRSSPDAESPEPEPKRQKRGPQSKAKTARNRSESDSELSDLGELSEMSEIEEEKPQEKQKRAAPKKAAPKKAAPKKAAAKKAAPKRKAKIVDSDNEEDEDAAIESDAGTSAKKEHKEDQVDNGQAGAEEAVPSKEEQNSDDEEKPTPKEGENKPAVDEEEEYSDVIDEPVKPKRKKKEKKEAGSRPAKAPKKAAVKKATTSDDPNVEEIKKLQGQLQKCGVRKLWHNELKQYGDDAKAKTRHLKKMLADVGMDGRFSEAKAREIKDRRELLAEVESTQEMNSLWGVAGRGRASRSKSKGVKVVESETSGAEGDDADADEDEDENAAYAARRKKVRADLAFLGDDSDSE